ncbi:hypothetical protein BJAS_P3570 [Bathymodiolus japonicus methanotrophic gill symbiont]|nr:hypothetical protein BJAS_P3570 [Bathymodiolus japonicus methanotrophic gill symbiont]
MNANDKKEIINAGTDNMYKLAGTVIMMANLGFIPTRLKKALYFFHGHLSCYWASWLLKWKEGAFEAEHMNHLLLKLRIMIADNVGKGDLCDRTIGGIILPFLKGVRMCGLIDAYIL